METKYKILILVVVAIVSFALGWYVCPAIVKTETRIVYVETQHQDTNQHSVTHTHTNADGSSDSTTTTDSNSHTDTQIGQTTETTTETIRSKDKLTLSALAGVSVSEPSLVYGVSVTKPVLGPFTIGLWGLTSREFGASVGISF